MFHEISQDQTHCRRCGTCCKKGGPALHAEDLPLVAEGRIPASALYTIRRGEPVTDNVRGGRATAESDIIKIRGVENGPACLFFDAAANRCHIYGNRPLQCRALKCWDTGRIVAIYQKDRLTRRMLMGRVADLQVLMDHHAESCDYDRLCAALHLLDAAPDDDRSLGTVRRALDDDLRVRQLIAERAMHLAEMADLLFGRPVNTVLKTLGYTVHRDGQCLTIKKRFSAVI